MNLILNKHSAYLSLGSNLGDCRHNIDFALEMINNSVGKIVEISHFYKSVPLGFVSENNFFNICVEVETSLSAHFLLEKLKEIELAMGRKTKSKNQIYADRIIDIDIIYYDADIVEEEDLIIPHRQMDCRKFVLLPLCDIAPEKVHPVLKKTNKNLLDCCSDDSVINVVNE